MKIPYDLIHQIENKYGTVNVPDSNPLMQKLHRMMGISIKSKFPKHDYDQEVIKLIKQGYNYREISTRIGHGPGTCRSIALQNGYHTRPAFKYIVKPNNQPEIYLSTTSNLKYFDITKSNHSNEVYKRMRKHINLITKHSHWCDIPVGGRYMISNNNTEIFVK